MTSQAAVQDFVSQKVLAIIGVSQNSQKFGNNIYRELKARGKELYPIHPLVQMIEGDPAFKDLASLPKKVDGVIVCVQPSKVDEVVHAIALAGIPRVWLQQGSSTPSAIQYCHDHNISVIHGECILMYAVGTGLHGFHAWLWKVFGKAPK